MCSSPAAPSLSTITRLLHIYIWFHWICLCWSFPDKHFPFFMFSIGTRLLLSTHKDTQTNIVFLDWSKKRRHPSGTGASLCFQSWIFILPNTTQSHLSSLSVTGSSSLSELWPHYPTRGCKSFTGPCLAPASTAGFDRDRPLCGRAL